MNTSEDFDRCPECHRPFVEGEVAYFVSEFSAGFRDRETKKYVVCKECYNKHYGWDYLITIVHVE